MDAFLCDQRAPDPRPKTFASSEPVDTASKIGTIAEDSVAKHRVRAAGGRERQGATGDAQRLN